MSLDLHLRYITSHAFVYFENYHSIAVALLLKGLNWITFERIKIRFYTYSNQGTLVL